MPSHTIQDYPDPIPTGGILVKHLIYATALDDSHDDMLLPRDVSSSLVYRLPAYLVRSGIPLWTLVSDTSSTIGLGKRYMVPGEQIESSDTVGVECDGGN